MNYVYGSRVFPSAPFAPVYFLENEGETDIGTYKPIGFLSPLQYIFFLLIKQTFFWLVYPTVDMTVLWVLLLCV